MVRATLRIRVYARALRERRLMARSRSEVASEDILVKRSKSRGGISALVKEPKSLPLCCWMRLAVSTLARMAADGSPGVWLERSLKGSAGTSIWMSMRSRTGPEIRAR